MEKFYEAKANLLQAENEMNKVTMKYNKLLDNFDSQSLSATNFIYEYRKFVTKYNLDKDNEGKSKKESNKEFSKYIRDNYAIECDPSNVNKFIENANLIARPVLDIIEKYKKELLSTYMKYSQVFRHATNIEGLEKINASKNRENQYLNEIVNGVFASSGYSDLINYIGRASTIGKGMHVENSVIIYPDNPFKSKEEQKSYENIELKNNVYLYSMDANKFEPVVDFKRDKEGKYSLEFGQEWISRNDRVECNCEVIDYIPKEELTEKQIFYKNERINVNELINRNSKKETIKAVKKAVMDGKLGYINNEYHIGKMKQEKENNYIKSETDKIAGFHDQKSEEHFEDMKTGKYTIPVPKIGKTTINTPTQAKQKAATVEAENINTKDKINEGESIDDN